jgi:hypothetical protein
MIPKYGDVWGNPDDPSTWRFVFSEPSEPLWNIGYFTFVASSGQYTSSLRWTSWAMSKNNQVQQIKKG